MLQPLFPEKIAQKTPKFNYLNLGKVCAKILAAPQGHALLMVNFFTPLLNKDHTIHDELFEKIYGKLGLTLDKQAQAHPSEHRRLFSELISKELQTYFSEVFKDDPDIAEKTAYFRSVITDIVKKSAETIRAIEAQKKSSSQPRFPVETKNKICLSESQALLDALRIVVSEKSMETIRSEGSALLMAYKERFHKILTEEINTQKPMPTKRHADEPLSSLTGAKKVCSPERADHGSHSNLSYEELLLLASTAKTCHDNHSEREHYYGNPLLERPSLLLYMTRPIDPSTITSLLEDMGRSDVLDHPSFFLKMIERQQEEARAAEATQPSSRSIPKFKL